jgi:type III pantothenate kinase
MLLAVDIGNSNVVFGVHDGERWAHHWRVRTVRDKMPDEYGVLFKTFMRDANLNEGHFEQIAISSVVPPLTGRIAEMLESHTDVAPLIIGHRVDTGLTLAVDNPAEVGADIIANAASAYARFERACIAVDFGTASTFSAISDDAAFLGVAIAPGLNIAAAALTGGTAQLPQVDLTTPGGGSVIGTNTVDAIQAGVMWGYVGLVEGLIDRLREELGADVPVIATGGLSRRIAPLTDRFAVVDPWLTLEGVRRIALRNR